MSRRNARAAGPLLGRLAVLGVAAVMVMGADRPLDAQPPEAIPGGGLVSFPASIAHVARVIDLTYPFDEQTVYWPNAQPFRWTKESWGIGPNGLWYAAARYAASEHGGTHLDSPVHF